jgi:glutamyl-tRNA synthetase
MYRQYADRLVNEGNAYYAFDTPEELEAMRQRLVAANVPNQQYNAVTRMQMRNSLTLSPAETQELIASGRRTWIRLKVPRKEEIRLHDLIRGWVMVHSSTVDDKVLLKSDGMPTVPPGQRGGRPPDEDYARDPGGRVAALGAAARAAVPVPGLGGNHAAVCPPAAAAQPRRQRQAQQAVRRQVRLPGVSAQLERHRCRNGEPTTIKGFREWGYLPEAVINFLALLGWNPGTEQELFTMDELIGAFSIERVGKAGTKFDIDKAKWFNQQYLRTRPDAELAGQVVAELTARGIACPPERPKRLCG